MNQKIFCYCICLLGCLSCVEDINLDEKHERQVVVNCALHSGPAQILTLTYSNPLGKFYYDEVEQAVVTLFEDNQPVGQFTKNGFMQWKLEFTPTEGRAYKLKVDVPGEPVITASTTMPPRVCVSQVKRGGLDEPIYFRQNKTANSCYVFIINNYGDEVVVDPIVYPHNELADQIGTNHPCVDQFNMEEASDIGDTTPAFLSYLRISNEVKDVDWPVEFCVDGSLQQSMLFFRAASKEYDRYLKTSLQKMLVYEAFDDPSQWFDENVVYSNITNGLGIFAAYNDKVFNYTIPE
ncbi:DUF4249 domain-containing protein [Marinilabiliaceae bacterium JC017]|nr:DUF4249 domain-containing protein [Marinilabiliaceae bacterium JC017]